MKYQVVKYKEWIQILEMIKRELKYSTHLIYSEDSLSGIVSENVFFSPKDHNSHIHSQLSKLFLGQKFTKSKSFAKILISAFIFIKIDFFVSVSYVFMAYIHINIIQTSTEWLYFLPLK